MKAVAHQLIRGVSARSDGFMEVMQTKSRMWHLETNDFSLPIETSR
jgi:hypothetical protein